MGITVFGLIASLVTVPYTLLVLTGYTPPIGPVPTFEDPYAPQEIAFLVLASLFSVGFTVFAWRTLVRSARRDAQRLRAREQASRDAKQYAQQRRGPRGPT